MQCVILAAGKGTRMRPLTDFRPKTLVKVNERPLLDYIVEALPDVIDELVMVIGYRGEQVKEHCGDRFYGKHVEYVEQSNPVAGTANALITAREKLRGGKFLVLMGDDLYGKDGLTKAVAHELCLIAAESDEPEKLGIVTMKEDGTLKEIIDTPDDAQSNIVPTGAMVLDERIFNYETEPDSKTGEQYLPNMVVKLAQDVPIAIEILHKWYPIGYPGDVVVVERMLKEISLVE